MLCEGLREEAQQSLDEERGVGPGIKAFGRLLCLHLTQNGRASGLTSVLAGP